MLEPAWSPRDRARQNLINYDLLFIGTTVTFHEHSPASNFGFVLLIDTPSSHDATCTSATADDPRL